MSTVAFAVVLCVSAIVLAKAGRDTTFYYDEWNFVLERVGWRPHDLLRPHNEHLSLVPVVIFKILFETVGLGAYDVFRGVLIALVLILGTLVFIWSRRRVGDWPAISLTAAVMMMGPAWIDLIWAFQIGFAVSLICGVGVLLCFDRGGGLRDVLAMVLLAVGLGSSSLGLMTLAAAAVEILLRPDRRSRWWVVAVPLVMYAAWYVSYGVPSAKASNIVYVPGWIANAAPPAVGAVSGFAPYGAVLTVILVFFLVRRLIAPHVSVRLVALLVLPLSFWATAALARAGTTTSPADIRYLLPGGLFVGLVAVELASQRLHAQRVTVAVAVLLGAGAVINATSFPVGSATLQAEAAQVRGALAALDLVGEQDVSAELTPVASQPQLRAGPYFAAAQHYNSTPAWPLDDLDRAPIAVRTAFDATLASLQGAHIEIIDGATGCKQVSAPPGQDLDLPLPANGLVVRAGRQPVEVRLRRLVEGFAETGLGNVAPGANGLVLLPDDRLDQPWHVGLRSAASFDVCSPPS